MAGHRLSRAAYGLAFLLAANGAMSAGALQVNPVRATLSASHPVAALTVRNTGAEPTVVQLEAVGWTQHEEKDVYSATREILATPPIFTVPPGGSQVVRVGLRRAPDAQRELTYRLFLEEVPPPPKAGMRGMQIALRVGVPVFVSPGATAAPVLQWEAARTSEGAIELRLTNSGNAHIKVANFKLALADNGQPEVKQQVATYVLPGQTHAWIVKGVTVPWPGAGLRLVAQTDAGDVQAEVPIQP